MENLAPAGNREALERADAAGADAVYLGYAAFSARAGAGNFNREELADAIRYAHLRHMRVHVTVNTLVKDEELDAVTDVLRMLRRMRADAVLVQDLGVLRIARAVCPGLTIHASTQMAIHNRAGCAWCASRGIRRVVLARECSLDEIRRCTGAGVEIEVFGHGAQCVAVSGMCLFSSMVGERSGNRGRCAQPCRLEYTYRGKRGAWLSPRDVCLRDDLDRLADAGVASLKIEGRLKRPEYVATVAASYRKGLDQLAAGDFAPVDRAEREALKQIFNRGGFMKGYALGCEDAAVIDPAGSGHRGLPLGVVLSVDGARARVRLERPLKDGDGLAIRHGRDMAEMIYAGKDTPAGETALLRLRDGVRAEAGDGVMRLSDAGQLAAARAMPGRRVKVDIALRAVAGEPLELTVTDGESRVRRTGGLVSAARTRAATPEELARNLCKTGDTVFIPGECRVETENAFVPVGEVNRLRREALDALAEARIAAFAPDTGEEAAPPAAELPAAARMAFVTVRGGEQAALFRQSGARIIWAPEDGRMEALERTLDQMAAGDWLQLPEVCEEDTLEGIRALCLRYRDTLGGVVLGSVGQLGVDWPVPFGAGGGIPVMNRQAAALLLEEGCAFVTASPELTGKELRALTAGEAPILVKTWGRTQLMLLHHCPARTALGYTKGRKDCALCDTGHPDALAGTVLEDRRGYRFPLLRQRLPEGCLVRLMNALPTDWLDKREIRNPWVELTNETPEEAAIVAEAFLDGRKTGLQATSGHWNRTVE